MKKHDDIKLDVTSNIDEKIVDEVTDKKIALSNKPQKGGFGARKRIIVIAAVAATLAIMLGIFIGVLVVGSNVPVYEGMTIQNANARTLDASQYEYKTSETWFLSAKSNRIGKFELLDKTNGTPNGVANGHHKDENKELESDIRDIVTIEVMTDDEVRYYIKPGEKFIIEIHIDNPKDYEIQSFTLNGEKYANYMFKEGSTMELLLLEVTAPNEPGYVEYTIDAIKYIDGTEIKDVDMSSGDKSIKAGIAYPTAPLATVTSQSITPTSIELSINVTDEYSLIGENELTIYLTDGESVISSKPLTVGENNITFDNLSMNKTYEYGVVTAYDLVDGKNLHKEWLLTNTITTAGAFGINNAVATQDSISFAVEKIGEVGEITSISLFDAETDDHVASGGADIREFTGLLSNRTYNLYVDFKYTLDGEEISDWVAVKGISTIAKTEPTISFGSIASTDSAVSGVLNMTDPNAIGTVNSVELYKDGSLAKNNAEKKINFTELDSYTAYQIVVTYTFDLNDGVGVQTKTATYDFTTSPHLEFNSCQIINTDTVKEGDKIYMQVELDNPSGALPSSVVVNGQEYNCSASTTPNKIFVEIVNNGQFEGGEVTLTVEKVNMTLDGKKYSVTATQNNSDTVSIQVKLENLKVIEDISLTVQRGADYIEESYIYPNDKTYVLLEFLNQSYYKIDSIKLEPYGEKGEYKNLDVVGDTFSVPDPVKLTDGNYVIEVSPETYCTIAYKVEIKYSSLDGTESASASISTNTVFRLMSDEVKEISTPDDLLNMNEGYYYKLMNDIDLDGISWKGAEFSGVFDGCGYSIKNMSRVGGVSWNDANPYATAGIGLFKHGGGVIKNLNMTKVTLLLDANDIPVYVGSIIGRANNTVHLENCHVDNESVIIVNDTPYEVTVGGLAGSATFISNCSSGASISSKYTRDDGFPGIGGIVGKNAVSIQNCIFYGTINGHNFVGGIMGNGSSATIANCANYGSVNGSNCVGGIIGLGSSAKIANCINYGAVKGSDFIGIENGADNPYNATVENCYALGENVTVEQLNAKSFYTDTLGWDETVWNLDDLDIENGKYPTLR